jgi:large conductance mechanosensitive channel
MSGFKNFLLRGNLVDLAVAVIIGTSFALVVSTFTNWLTAQIPESASQYFTNEPNTFGAFLNAVIAFVIMAAVVYFFVVMPYTTAKEKFFPSPAPGTPEDITLLKEIRDILAAGSTTASSTSPPQA